MSSPRPFTRQHRASPADPAPAWDAKRRALYLLRPDIARPHSIDPSVWPEAPDGLEIIAAVVAGPDPQETQEYAGSLGTVSIGPNETWTMLGYDVADSGFTSGLSNCGYRPDIDDVESLRRDWGSRLNDRGLFDSLEHADEFRRVSDARIPEHAPFFVFALYERGDPGSRANPAT